MAGFMPRAMRVDRLLGEHGIGGAEQSFCTAGSVFCRPVCIPDSCRIVEKLCSELAMNG
jgi:hypothetical protein